MLGDRKGSLLNYYVPDYVLFDLETTGISASYDDVIEISAVKVRGGNVVDEFSQLVNPGRHIPYGASMVNNITDDMVADAPSFEQVLPAFLEFIGDDVLAGHNIHAFDMKFLYRDCEKYFGRTLTNNYVDTLKLSKFCFPAMRHHRLSDMAEHYGISTAGAHRALADCRMNQKVLEMLSAEMQGSRGKSQASSQMVKKSQVFFRTEKKSPASSKAVKEGQASSRTVKEGQAYSRTVKKCPDCGSPMVMRSGRYGKFWGCTAFPGCRHTENIRKGSF